MIIIMTIKGVGIIIIILNKMILLLIILHICNETEAGKEERGEGGGVTLHATKRILCSC